MTWTRLLCRLFLPALLVAAAVVMPAALATPSTTHVGRAPAARGPGGPILVITGADNPFSRYYGEILRAEGLNEFDVEGVADVTSATLAAHDVAILGDVDVTATEIGLLRDWVRAGGDLIAMRPDPRFAELLGLKGSGSSVSDGYLKVDTSKAPGAGIVGSTMQFHGVADRYWLNGATSIADLYADASSALPSPAVSVHSVGSHGGRAAAFTYDLARSVVSTRQGDPARVGQGGKGRPPRRSSNLFFGRSSLGAEPDWVDRSKLAIPQADEQQRLLANLIIHLTADKRPLPRFWYLPRGLKAAVIMTGDDHGHGGTAGRFDDYMAESPAGCNVARWECIRGSSYIFPDTPLSSAQATAYTAKGFEIGLHVNTGCADFTPSSLRTSFETQLMEFRDRYPEVRPQSTERLDCVPWSDWASVPKVERAHGIRLDTTYYYWPRSWVRDRPGLFTGSGLPMRFADSDGSVLDVYQAPTQLTDESGQSLAFTIDTLLDRALGPEGYYGAFTANMHTDAAASSGSDAIVASAKARGVPVVSGRQMLTWLDGRNRSSFESIEWRGGSLSFRVAAGAGATELRGMLPTRFGGRSLQAITRDGRGIDSTRETVKGVGYAFFAAPSGEYTATYSSSTA